MGLGSLEVLTVPCTAQDVGFSRWHDKRLQPTINRLHTVGAPRIGALVSTVYLFDLRHLEHSTRIMTAEQALILGRILPGTESRVILRHADAALPINQPHMSLFDRLNRHHASEVITAGGSQITTVQQGYLFSASTTGNRTTFRPRMAQWTGRDILPHK